MNVFFSKTARKEYDAWKRSNPKTVERIEELVFDIVENGLPKGKGKPEQLKYYKNPPRFSGHISQADRLVYCPSGKDVLILSCKGHYDDR